MAFSTYQISFTGMVCECRRRSYQVTKDSELHHDQTKHPLSFRFSELHTCCCCFRKHHSSLTEGESLPRPSISHAPPCSYRSQHKLGAPLCYPLPRFLRSKTRSPAADNICMRAPKDHFFTNSYTSQSS